MEQILRKIQQNPRYQANIKYGKPRRGHSEGTVEAHIQQLEENLEKLKYLVTDQDYQKLKILIHVHDSFKAESKKNASIEDPMSHASLAASFLSNYIDDQDMRNMIQYHDLGYALYRNFKTTGRLNVIRLEEGLGKIHNKDLYLLFCIIDSCTPSKGREMITWWVEQVKLRFPEVWVTKEHILPGEMLVDGAW
jgi:hypothetical protein